LKLTDSNKLTVIDFHATWCGPCHQIAPVFESLAKQYGTVNFLKCDVDAAKDVSQLYAVSAMPTFIFLKGSKKVDQVRGADKRQLQATLSKYASPAPASASTPAFAGKGHTLGGETTTGRSFDAVKEVVGTGVDKQLLVLVGLIGFYLFNYWYNS